MWKEFKTFISRGSVIDLAVGVIIGAAFTSIVNSLVNDIIMPVINLIIGSLGLDFTGIKIETPGDPILIGSFIGAIINFLLIALVIFLIVKAINSMHKKPAEAPAQPEHLCPYCKKPVDKDATRCPYCTSVIEPEQKTEKG